MIQKNDGKQYVCNNGDDKEFVSLQIEIMLIRHRQRKETEITRK